LREVEQSYNQKTKKIYGGKMKQSDSWQKFVDNYFVTTAITTVAILVAYFTILALAGVHEPYRAYKALLGVMMVEGIIIGMYLLWGWTCICRSTPEEERLALKKHCSNALRSVAAASIPVITAMLIAAIVPATAWIDIINAVGFFVFAIAAVGVIFVVVVGGAAEGGNIAVIVGIAAFFAFVAINFLGRHIPPIHYMILCIITLVVIIFIVMEIPFRLVRKGSWSDRLDSKIEDEGKSAEWVHLISHVHFLFSLIMVVIVNIYGWKFCVDYLKGSIN
jgi:hypothetical protein